MKEFLKYQKERDKKFDQFMKGMRQINLSIDYCN